MLKRNLLLLLTFLLVGTAYVNGQNIQLHYDLGSALYSKELKDRPILTTTVEKFHPDRWGSTFFFIDMDYTSSGLNLAYWELTRELAIAHSPFSVHLRYCGGITKFGPKYNAYIGGLTYTHNAKDFSKGFSLTLGYRHIQKHPHPSNVQFTGTWYTKFCDDLYTFNGFFEMWSEKKEHSNFVMISEPQFWINLNRLQGVSDDFNLSIGSEVEISQNFGGMTGFHVIPTLALKWTFN